MGWMLPLVEKDTSTDVKDMLHEEFCQVYFLREETGLDNFLAYPS